MYCQMKLKDVTRDVYNHNIVTPSNQPMFLHEYKRQYAMHCQLNQKEKTHESVGSSNEPMFLHEYQSQDSVLSIETKGENTRKCIILKLLGL